MARIITPRWLDHGGADLILAFSPDGTFLLGASRGTAHGVAVSGGPSNHSHTQGEAVLWNTTDWTVQTRFNDDYFHDVAWHPAKHLIATSSRTRVTSWDLSSEKPSPKYLLSRYSFLLEDEPATTGEYVGLAFSPGGKSLAVCSEYGFPDADVLLLDSETAEIVGTLSKNKDDREVLWVKYVSDGEHVIGLSYAYQYLVDRAYLWNSRDHTHLRTFDFYGDGVMHIESSPDGRRLGTMEDATPGQGGDEKASCAVRLWDAISGSEINSFLLAGKCFCFGVSPDTSILAAVIADVKRDFSPITDNAPEYVFTVWDIPSGQMRAGLKSSNQESNLLSYFPETLRFSPCGRWVAVRHPKHVEVWDLQEILGS